MPPKKKPDDDVVVWAYHNCHCPERLAAQRSGEFVYSPRYEGWVFPLGPLRHMTRATREAVYISRQDYRHPDHGGEPYVYPYCPWCFGELDHARPPDPFRQADGGSA